jgi:hypothetical protein
MKEFKKQPGKPVLKCQCGETEIEMLIVDKETGKVICRECQGKEA